MGLRHRAALIFQENEALRGYRPRLYFTGYTSLEALNGSLNKFRMVARYLVGVNKELR